MANQAIIQAWHAITVAQIKFMEAVTNEIATAAELQKKLDVSTGEVARLKAELGVGKRRKAKITEN